MPYTTYLGLLCMLVRGAGARVAQWVRSLDLSTHTDLSPIRRGFAPGFVNYKRGCTWLAAASDNIYQLLAHGRWFSPASFTTKTGRHDIAEILLKVALKHQKIKSNRRGARATANRAHALRRHCLGIGVRVPIALYFHWGSYAFIVTNEAQTCQNFKLSAVCFLLPDLVFVIKLWPFLP
jgi:hypothetical protein